ncbi:HNH endonuclease [Bacillus mycoides]|uniref:HNH endonuclease n=1 Tax=Bacillus mycoides TaxID=1405 RepID=UPI003D646FD9
MLLKICRCGKTVSMEEGICEACAAVAEERRKKKHRDYKAKRTDVASQKLYTSKPREIRRAQVKHRDNGLCQLCWDIHKAKPMDTVHHIIPLEENERLVLVKSNLISLCEKCHQKVHKLYKVEKENFNIQKN